MAASCMVACSSAMQVAPLGTRMSSTMMSCTAWPRTMCTMGQYLCMLARQLI
jgi:hypothetical protein